MRCHGIPGHNVPTDKHTNHEAMLTMRRKMPLGRGDGVQGGRIGYCEQSRVQVSLLIFLPEFCVSAKISKEVSFENLERRQRFTIHLRRPWAKAFFSARFTGCWF